ncbi:VOC family protein [Eubacterium barkeri]|uniref:Glyoxalase/Bleomycin resistance protein/Dioxygenase superfamily protein n=1 Tax=Eubacterium barkeri TaxID=1528 RepID=A0A1H3GSD9_EUBBA|nr:VOC family protein [Eubacterium barkeri]SDY06233.1 Glyoxalase/Bleomycin resistance protein/Dioxygenase superfamily protein [Eubacterium barkeri]
MSLPKFIGLSHVCIIVDNLDEAVAYYQRILGAVPDQCIPHWRNKGFFEAAGFVREAEDCDISIAFLSVPGTVFTIELMEYHAPKGRKEPVVFAANDVSGARHVALKVSNIEEAFEHIKAQPDAQFINPTEDYGVYQISKTFPDDFYYYDAEREADKEAKQAAADVLGTIKYFYFIDKYGLQWEFEQGHTDIGD